MAAKIAGWRSAFMAALAAMALVCGSIAPTAAQNLPSPPAALQQDAAFARFIAMIRGHLLSGTELAGQRKWDAAYPHFRFPSEEVYGMIRDDLRLYRTPPFDGALKSLARTVKARSSRHYAVALKRVEDALAAAEAGLKARQENWPRFVLTVAVAVLKIAPDEYDDAIVKGRIVRPIGYQTARGFILQAERMMESVAGEFPDGNAAAWDDIRAGFVALKRAFAPVTPHRRAVLDYDAVLAIVTQIEMAVGRLA